MSIITSPKWSQNHGPTVRLSLRMYQLANEACLGEIWNAQLEASWFSSTRDALSKNLMRILYIYIYTYLYTYVCVYIYSNYILYLQWKQVNSMCFQFLHGFLQQYKIYDLFFLQNKGYVSGNLHTQVGWRRLRIARTQDFQDPVPSCFLTTAWKTGAWAGNCWRYLYIYIYIYIYA